MKCLINKNKIKKDGLLLYLKMYAALFIIFIISFFLLAYPEYSSEGIRYGISLCYNKLIPSLFPFMIASSFLLKSQAYKGLTYPFGILTEKLLRLPQETLPVILMSFIGGYPLGGILTSTLYEEKKITQDDAKHLMSFTFNPSISFCIGFIGSAIYESLATGLIIYLSSVIPSLITAVIYGRIKKEVYVKASGKQGLPTTSLSAAFTEAVSESTVSMTGICVTVIIFSSLINLTNVFTHNPYIQSVIGFLLEVTSFTEKSNNLVSVYIISAAVSLGGICTHFQVMPYLLKMKISYKHFLFFRLSGAFLTYIISRLIFYLIPDTVTTAATDFGKASLSNAGIPVSCVLIIMAAIIIFTDNTVGKIKMSRKF